MDKDKKLQIIRAAVKRFTRHGLKKTTLDEIARDLRIGKASIYHYFDSKESLFYDSVRWEQQNYIEELRGILLNGELALNERINNYFSFKKEYGSRYKLNYDLLVLNLSGQMFENEAVLLKELFQKELDILTEAVKPDSKDPDLPRQILERGLGKIVLSSEF